MLQYYLENGAFFCRDRYRQLELGPPALAHIADVDRETAVRWCNGHRKPHPDRAMLFALRALGRILPASGPWAHVWVENDVLRLADGGTVAAASLPAWAFDRQLLESLKVEIRQAREYILYLESMLPRATVVKFDLNRTRPSATSAMARALNPYFEGNRI